MSEKSLYRKVVQAAAKRLPFISERKLEARLDDTPLSPAEIYILGAEEAQGEILRRIHALVRPADPTTPGKEP